MNHCADLADISPCVCVCGVFQFADSAFILSSDSHFVSTHLPVNEMNLFFILITIKFRHWIFLELLSLGFLFFFVYCADNKVVEFFVISLILLNLFCTPKITGVFFF